MCFYLYLGDECLGNLGEVVIFIVCVECLIFGEWWFFKMLEWEYFNGECWCEFEEVGIEIECDCIVFWGLLDIDEIEVNEYIIYWVWGWFIEVFSLLDEMEVDVIVGKIEILGDGVELELVYYNFDGEVYLLFDLDCNLKIFGDEFGVD